ncbi:hypothetical protein ACLMPM_24270 [Yersinia enterocolitica]|uniref:hypothetical protein n=1 Tax=Yersinia enterocolitica TaxID=630 RepID=UPI00398D6836
MVNMEQTVSYLVNISDSVNGEWIVDSTIVRVKNGIISTVVGVYDSLIVKRGYSLAVRAPSSASTTRYSTLVFVRNSERNKANMSIAITQTSQGLVRLG